MEKVSSSERFKTLMDERNLRQVDILNLVLPYCKKYNVKMNKSDISQYVSGKTEPSQEKLVVLGMALNVSESWLMGFNVGLRGSGYSGSLMFWTAHAGYMRDAFDVQATQYVIKGYEDGRVFSVIDTTLGRLEERMLTVKFKGDFHRVFFRNIEYIESRGQMCIIHCTCRHQYGFYRRLHEIEKVLDRRFVRCHRSYIVNMDYIANIASDIKMISGDIVSISQNRKREIEQIYQEYLEE